MKRKRFFVLVALVLVALLGQHPGMCKGRALPRSTSMSSEELLARCVVPFGT
ncbi:MAG: hypothetical protein JSV86_14215 [Gemmatimonadota bacterium]|nr:MAG: hypothetical protein JSV86_14215 [Gemmatimonadota bacterium]